MEAFQFRSDIESHPCEMPGCTNMVSFDDEPFCFVDSADAGSDVEGYSYRKVHPEWRGDGEDEASAKEDSQEADACS